MKRAIGFALALIGAALFAQNASAPAGRAGGAQRSNRMFFRAPSMSSASSSNPGAITTSVNTSATWRAIAAVTFPLAAITPPNAETGSHACAFACASARSFPIAMPHGLECLMIATHGWPKSYAARRAASATT